MSAKPACLMGGRLRFLPPRLSPEDPLLGTIPVRCIGIDYGEKRIGLAFGDAVGVAVPLPAAVQSKLNERLAHIEQTARERQADRFVIGYPLHMNGDVGAKAREVDTFVEKLTRRLDLPVHRIDERLTSRAASQGRRAAGQGPADRRSGVLDSQAATLILQDYLDTQVILPLPEEDV